MSLKAELETWAAALKAYDAEEFAKAIDLFNEIADNSKILTNIGLIYATLGEHEAAVQQFIAATELDQYLAVAYFQCGVSNFLLQRYDLALQDFEGALLQLRGNEDINYEQLGLKFKLYAAEVLFNKGLSMIYLGNLEEGLAVMREAQIHKVTAEHNVIDDAIAERGDGYTVFSIVRHASLRVHDAYLTILVAYWRPLSSLRDEAQEHEDERLHGQSCTYLTCLGEPYLTVLSTEIGRNS